MSSVRYTDVIYILMYVAISREATSKAPHCKTVWMTMAEKRELAISSLCHPQFLSLRGHIVKDYKSLAKTFSFWEKGKSLSGRRSGGVCGV